MQRFDRITWNPEKMNGQPCIRGMRLTVRRVVEAVALYPNRDDLFRNYPELEPDDVQAPAPAWLFAAELREGTVIRLLTPFARTVPILAVRPASRRMSAKVRIFIEHLEKTF